MSQKIVAKSLILENGAIFRGQAFGDHKDVFGEVVFNTSMTGYVEVATDPSYAKQIVVMSAPEIGCYGVCKRDMESPKIWAEALVVRHVSDTPSNWRASRSLSEWMKEESTPGITGIDTRALVRMLRDAGTMRGAVVSADRSPSQVLKEIRATPKMQGQSLTTEVSCSDSYVWKDEDTLKDPAGEPVARVAEDAYHVVAIDFGMKASIARLLHHHGCKVTVVPADTDSEAIIALSPSGVFLSNGPGDPATQTAAVQTVRELIGKLPIFGICMGHQIIAQAMNRQTYKTRFGHRGANQPVKTRTGRVWITAQNHGFAVDAPTAGAKPTPDEETNVSDGTNEGLWYPDLKLFSVQYHPEAAPGPHDARPLFGTFSELMRTGNLALTPADVTASTQKASAA